MRSFTVMLLVATVATAVAQAPPVGKLSDFLTGSGLQINFGYKNDFIARKSKDYLQVSFKDVTLFSHGDPIKGTDFGIADDPISFGDAPLTLRIGEGSSQIGGTLFSSIGVAPIPLPGLPASRFRLIAGYDGQLEQAKQSTFFAGAEWVPFGAYSKDKETFLGASARYERRNTSASTQEETGTANIRGRVGVGMDLRLTQRRIDQITADLQKVLPVEPKDLPEFLDVFRTRRSVPIRAILVVGMDDAIRDAGLWSEDHPTAVQSALGTVRQSGEGPLVQAMKDLQEPARTKLMTLLKDDIVGTLRAKTSLLKDRIKSQAAPNNPRISLFGEFDGSYRLSTQVAGPRGRAVYSLNLRYSLNATDDNSPFVLARFENGRTRAEPDQQISSFMVMGVFKF